MEYRETEIKGLYVIQPRIFEDERGNAPKRATLFTGNVEFNLFLTDQFFISAGYSMSNEVRVPNRSFFSISYLN